MTLKLWLRTIRIQTLVASVIPIVLFHVLILHNISYIIFFSSLLSALCIQIATNLFNDLHDFESGVDTDERKGPKRALQLGVLSRQEYLDLTLCFFIFAALFGVPLVIQGGSTVLVCGILSLVFAYGYTGGLIRLSQRGIAEPFVIAFFGIIPIYILCHLYGVQFGLYECAIGFICGVFSTLLLAINNLRDFESDKRAMKNTPVVRFGELFGKIEILFLVYFIFFLTCNFFSEKIIYFIPTFALLMIVSFISVISSQKKLLPKTLKFAAISYLLWCVCAMYVEVF